MSVPSAKRSSRKNSELSKGNRKVQICIGHWLLLFRNVKKHVDKVHKRIRPFICELCGACYAEDCELKAHIARHNKDKPFSCSYCDYTTSEKGNFQSEFHSHMLRSANSIQSLLKKKKEKKNLKTLWISYKESTGTVEQLRRIVQY